LPALTLARRAGHLRAFCAFDIAAVNIRLSALSCRSGAEIDHPEADIVM
jgi:hypothetical protein